MLSHLICAAEIVAALIPAGTYRMGTPATEIPALKSRFHIDYPGVFEDETPNRAVTVEAFRMDRYEVTNADFIAFIDAHPEWRESWRAASVAADQAQHPVAFVTWNVAEAFCEARGGRLPKEAEWEYAARAGSNSDFPWGDEMPSPSRANYGASGLHGTTPVGSYAPNPFGLYDLAGNVWEFMLDRWPASTAAGAERRVIRGGSYDGAPVNLRTRWRDSHEVSNAVAYVGFRCVYPLVDKRNP